MRTGIRVLVDSGRRDAMMADGIELLAEDHREIERLFEHYRSARDDAIAHDILDQLAMHTAIEEQVLYPEIRRIVDGGDDLADRAEAEHAAVKQLVGRALTTPPPDLAGLVEQLRRDVEEHVAYEEQELFPELRESGTDLDALGASLGRARAAHADGETGSVSRPQRNV